MSGKEKSKILILLVLWAAAFYPIYPELVRDWLDLPDNSHGFIVPVVAGYFAWQRRGQLQSVTPGSSWWGGAVFVLSLAGYILSYAGNVAFPSRFAMVLSLFGLIWFCLGSETIRILLLPVLFLLFMIPVPYSLLNLVSLPLQFMATRLSAHIIDACSIPVYREGNMLYFVGTQLEVAEACSGIRSIMSLTMVAIAFASMVKEGWGKKAILVLSSVPIAMLANIVRISGTGVLAHFFGDEVAKGFLHEFSGIAIFAFGMTVLFGIFHLFTGKKRDYVK
jgi:exosortase